MVGEDAPRKTPDSSFWSRHWQKMIAGGIWVLLVGSFIGYGIVAKKSPTDILRYLIGLLQTPYGAILFIVLYTLRPLAFFSATVLTIASGSIFGPVWGVVLTIIGSNLSATVAYTLGFFLGKGMLQTEEGESGGMMSKYANRLRRNSFETIFIMRLIYLPYDFVNYLAGLLHIRYLSFILATIIGSIPGTISFVLAGASIRIDDVFEENFRPEFSPWTLASAVALFLVSIAISRWMKQRETKRLEN